MSSSILSSPAKKDIRGVGNRFQKQKFLISAALNGHFNEKRANKSEALLLPKEKCLFQKLRATRMSMRITHLQRFIVIIVEPFVASSKLYLDSGTDTLIVKIFY